jgi:hypothetical protein
MLATREGCGAKMIWAYSPTDARSPIDPKTSPDGNVLLLSPTGYEAPLAVTPSKGALDRARAKGLGLRLHRCRSCRCCHSRCCCPAGRH